MFECITHLIIVPVVGDCCGDDSMLLPIIGTGIVVVLVIVCLGITVICMTTFVIWWNRQKKAITQVPSAEPLVRSTESLLV